MPAAPIAFSAPLDYVPEVEGPAEPSPEALWFVFSEARLLVSEGDVVTLPAFDAPRLDPTARLFLGRLGGREVYAAEAPGDFVAPPGYRWSDLRSLFSRLEDALFALGGRAVQILDWNRTHRYCGRCGTPTVARGAERSRECPACGLVVYPRLAPAVMALVRREPGQILLARAPRFRPGMYSALAGFVEPGETIEQCLHREVREEVGIEVANLRYFGSQPWPFPHSLMIAFVADWAGGEILIDPVEIEAAEWFRIAQLPQLPPSMSIARRLIDAVVAEMAATIR